jgi:hyperosmotically inducible periplasmic protein
VKKATISLCVSAIVITLTGCSSTSANARVEDDIRQSLKAGGLNEVSVSQDREKGVITLTGTVPSDGDKARADQIARSDAGNQVVADQIAVVPPNDGHDAKAINSDIDKGIEKNLDAALIQNSMNKHVKYSVKNGVVTLTGNVRSQAERKEAMQVAKSVPNVQQVVNEIQLKNQPASSSR